MSNLLDGRRLIFYDFEVLSKCKLTDTNSSYWCVVFIDYESKGMRIIKNNVDELRSFYNTCKDDIFIGYNSRNYDQYILKGLLLGMDAGHINDELIEHHKKGYQVVSGGNRVQFYNYDCATGFHSLKQLEAFMGSEIKESDVPFTIDRPLTEDEEKDLIKYCIHDVKETINVFEKSRGNFDSHIKLMEMNDMDINLMSKTNAQLTAIILEAEKKKLPEDEFDFIYPDTMDINKYTNVVEWFKGVKDNYTKDSKKIEYICDIAGMETTYALGGVHSAIPNYVEEGILVSADVASLYPALILEYGLMTRTVESDDKFRNIRDTRLEYKKAKNPMQAPLKIVINSVYGCFGDQYNNLYDPKMMRSVCVSGQLLLTDLVEKIEPYCQIFNLNTDGVFFKVDSYETLDKIKAIAKEWETRTRLDLEWEEYVKVIQKDVNNYIIVDKDGKYKGKGAYVKDLSELDYDLPIVNEALVNYFVYETPLAETINNCTELHKFQKVVKLTSAYKYAMKNCTFSKRKVLNEVTGKMNTKTLWDENGEILQDKTFRIFSSVDENDGGIFKRKEGKNPEKFANTPDNCFIDNEDVTNKVTPDKLDRQFYIDLAQKRVNQYLGISNRKKKVDKTEITE